MCMDMISQLAENMDKKLKEVEVKNYYFLVFKIKKGNDRNRKRIKKNFLSIF